MNTEKLAQLLDWTRSGWLVSTDWIHRRWTWGGNPPSLAVIRAGMLGFVLLVSILALWFASSWLFRLFDAALLIGAAGHLTWLGRNASPVQQEKRPPEEDAAFSQWIAQVSALTPKNVKHRFNNLLRTDHALVLHFNLHFKGIANRDALGIYHTANLTPEAFLTRVVEHILSSMEALVCVFPTSILLSSEWKAWEALQVVFDHKVSEATRNGFGCNMRLADMMREKTDLERDLDGMGSALSIEELKATLSLLREAKEQRSLRLRAAGYDMEDPEFTKVDEAIHHIEENIESTKRKLVKSQEAARKLDALRLQSTPAGNLHDLLGLEGSQLLQGLLPGTGGAGKKREGEAGE